MAVASAPASGYVSSPTVSGSGAMFSAGTEFGNNSSPCGEGQTAIGAGANLKPHQSGLALTGLLPINSGSFHVGSASAQELQPVSQDWTLVTNAFCALTGQPAPFNGTGYLKRVQIVHVESEFDSSNSHSVKASCPPGKVLIGGGGDVDAGDNVHQPDEVGFDRSGPKGDAWVVRGHEVLPTSKDWQVEAKAICANADSDDPGSHYVDGVHTVSESTAFDSKSPKWAVAKCPEGENIIGGGAETSAEGPRLALSRSQPRTDNKTDTRWAAEAHEVVPSGGDWSITAYAVCANINAPRASDQQT